MSNGNPAPESSGGWPGDAGQVPADPQQPGPGYVPPPGQGAGPGQGYGLPPGPGFPAPQWDGPPGMAGYQPGRRRWFPRRARIGVGVVIGVIIVVSVVTNLRRSHTWKLTAPSTAAGLQRDTSPLDTLGLSDGVTGARSAITRLPGYGTLKSSVSAAYNGVSGPLVWFIGFNGTFNKQIVLQSYQGARVSTVSAGPHGGAAECARATSATLCQWSTSSTVGELIVRNSVFGGPVSVAKADSLMIKMRGSVERPG